MKKMIMAAAIVCAAAVANAATVAWGSDGIQISGDFETGEGNYANSYAVYLFSTAGQVSQATMAGMIAADTGWSDAITGNAWIGSGITDGEGVLTVPQLTVADGNFSGYLVIFDNADYAAAGNAYVTDIYTVNDNSMHKMVMDYDFETFVDATGTWSAVNTGAVPEPTSGLLLILGMAGLALKRKVA